MGEFFEQISQRIRQTWNVWVGVAGAVFAVLLCGLVVLFVWVLTPEAEGANASAKAVVTRLPGTDLHASGGDDINASCR